jgi:gliding motility-associated-like protein
MAWNYPVTIEAQPDSFASYNWMPIEGLKNATGKSVDVKTDYKGWPGWLWVTAQTNELCFQKDSVYVNLVGPVQYAPSAFTPNGDGIHDTWRIPNIGYYIDNEVEIFDRWGTKVYAAKGYNNETIVFDGTRNGRPLPTGTYYYVIKSNDGNKPISGTITIVR